MTKFFDAHTHVHFPVYAADREAVLARAREAGVKMITVGTQNSTSAAAVALAEAHPENIWATVGFHPGHFAENWHHDKNEQTEAKRESFDPDRLLKLAKHKKVVAIGECGLDYFRLVGEGEKIGQQESFDAQIGLAKKTGKPLMIHCRNAFPDLIQTLSERKDNLLRFPGAIHFFSGTAEEARALLRLGFAFTFGGVITFARDYDEVIKMLSPEAILSETDAPYVAPAPYRGKRNEPAYVVEVIKKLAELKNKAIEEMAEIIAQNTERIFGVKI